ncbi:ALBINO3-like protein 1, chloroplastic isoform X3 [Camellia sinensis]|uniref:ALBINO3-like protein 1, chloroplastic isoform X3 n=1 Tax=Camellia sinensis TaxID=4442 RepID=UPI001035C2F2|nr:ALBINO3-like protein 1, chloroplastic isoform X3 [Camellia sinensis]
MLTLYPSYSLFSATADVTRSPPSALPQTSYLRASVSAAAVASSIQDLGTDIEKHHEVLADGLATLHVPYAYGFAIILLAVLVKAATFPLSKKQERIHLETARLYKLAGINPLAGCLPTLAIIPIWVGLYRSLSNAADEIFPE